MQFKEWSEDQFIEHIAKLFPIQGDIIGIGDDCAVIPCDSDVAWLITTDALVEGVHFLKEQIKAKDLGYKTVAVNVSDIVAMGGTPHYAFLSIALPKTIDSSWMLEVMEGLKEACDHWGVTLIGGDTVGSKRDLFINLTLVGSAAQGSIKNRGDAKAHDVICVTGYLGDSGGGLKALQANATQSDAVRQLIHAHFRPEPMPEEGRWLASQKEVHAMMDISDGLDCDLKRLLKRSGKGAVLEASQIPISPSLSKVSSELSWDPLELALAGGEDYCLLCTVDSQAFSLIGQEFLARFNHALHPIGYITEISGQLSYRKKGEPFPFHYSNFNHFQ